jgi:hypothetical protein
VEGVKRSNKPQKKDLHPPSYTGGNRNLSIYFFLLLIALYQGFNLVRGGQTGGVVALEKKQRHGKATDHLFFSAATTAP